MKFACFYCGSVYDERITWCSVCLEENSLLHLPESEERKLFVRPGREGLISSNELRKKNMEGRSIKGYEELGKLPKNFRMLVHGLPGSGKSTFCMQIANNYNGKSLYFSCEEGTGEDFIKKIVDWEIHDLMISDAATSMEIESDYKRYSPQLVVVDSISVIDKIPVFDCACIYINHSTKDGLYKGDSSIAHSVQIVVKVDDGKAVVEKNRFNKKCTLEIF